MKQTNRLLSLLLCIVMLISMLPLGVLAAEDGTVAQASSPIHVLAGGDFQEAGDHTASAENVTNILTTIKGTYPTMDGMLFIGDYDCETHGDSAQTSSGIAKLMETVQASYSNINHDNSILVQGNHDATNQYIDGSTTGVYGYDLNGYAAFVLNEDQYPNGGGASSGVQSLANTLETWLADKVANKYDEPIFIVSHLPLAFNPRTYTQGDGMYAKYIFDVLNAKAAEGLNIIFLHGHNHAYGYDEYLGGHAIYLAKGDSINIAVAGSKTSYTTETLNFTYMNAGYTGYYNESGYTTSNAGTDKLSMTVFTITDSEVTVGRYSASGTMELKAAGESKGDYINNVSVTPNTRTYATTQTVKLNKFVEDVTFADETTDVSVSAPGITGLTVTKVETTVPEEYSAYILYDIAPAGYTSGKATVTIPVDDTFDHTRLVTVIDVEGGTSVKKPVVDGKVTFTTEHFSQYALAQAAALAITDEDWKPTAVTGGSYTYTLDTDGINAGENNKYIIVAKNAAYALGSDGKAYSVTISNNSSTATTTTQAYEFWFTGSSNGLITQDGTNTLYQKSYRIHYGVSEGDHLNRFENEQNGQYRIYDGAGTNRSLYYSNSGWTVTETDHSNSSYRVRLYRYTSSTGGTATEWAALPSGQDLGGLAVGVMTQAQIEAGIVAYVTTDENKATYSQIDTSDLKFDWNKAYSTSEAGEYVVTISYKDVVLGSVNVATQVKTVQSITLPQTGSVKQNASASAVVDGAKIKVTYTDNTVAELDVTLDMLTPTVDTGIPGDYPGLTISYGGQTSSFTLTVIERNNYPEYPDEGAVKVNKTVTGIDFQSSGVAQVELSVSGVPSKKGADLIIMLDTSSSMTTWCVKCHQQNCSCGSQYKRSTVLEEALQNLIAQLKQPGADGEPLDIDVAIADFNGFYGANQGTSGTPYDRDANDRMKDNDYDAESGACVYTNTTNKLDATAFCDAASLAKQYTLNYQSGTNYDYAMDAIYQLAYAKKQANGAEERDLYVVFMSDGAAMQWNYYHAQGASDDWEKWIVGANLGDAPASLPATYTGTQMTSSDWDDLVNCTTHLYYFNDADTDGDGYVNEHRMANAIKGATDTRFEVIRKSTAGLEGVLQSAASGKENMYTLPGLGATMFSIAFDPQKDGDTDMVYQKHSIASIASEQTGTTQYYYDVTSDDELTNAFTAIGNEVAYAASNAHFEDKMGDAFSLQMATPKDKDGNALNNITPSIEVVTYDIYTRSEWKADGSDAARLHQIGTRQDNGKVTETVTFNTDGTEAYSTLIDDGITNILGTDGVIYAKSFLYNTTGSDVTVTLNGKQIKLAAESFYWDIGTVKEAEKALRYHVYLEGSMEGLREAGSYATNEYATIYYDNYLGNPCHKDTTSPVVAWSGANVSYAFYLVDENGDVITNQTTGATGSFSDRIAVTSPVVYQTIALNNQETFSVLRVSDTLPDGYTAYDEAATYHIEVNSNGTGTWQIVNGGEKTASTYVTQYLLNNASAYSNALTPPTTENDYTHTVVWFAVLWKPQALPDTVVIDYGLPVEISVLGNDMFGENGNLVAVGEYNETFENVTAGSTLGHNGNVQVWTNPGDDDTIDETTVDYVTTRGRYYLTRYGKAAVMGNKVVYQLNTMMMDAAEKLTYAVNYTGIRNEDGSVNGKGYYYDTVTIIPATTIYFEDTDTSNFVTFKAYDWSNNVIDLWTTVGETMSATQGEDRPGQFSLPEIDGDNVYGYDSAYAAMTKYSMGSAHKVTVTEKTNYATAEFSFKGTGFDVISLTSNKSGAITVEVTGDSYSKTYLVDTYYGYIWNEDTGWSLVTSETENALYQVPVMKVEGLPYGQYRVLITASYNDAFHHGQDGQDKSNAANSYDLYLDAVRIYDPADDGNQDDAIKNAYVKDNEGWPSYFELRNRIIENLEAFTQQNATIDGRQVTGAIYIDGKKGEMAISEYTSFGPNNELYLQNNQAVAFTLGLSNIGNIADVQIGLKSADGKTAIANILNVVENTSGAWVEANRVSRNVNTATDMYYSAYTQCTAGDGNAIIVLKNTGEGILSITNIKLTYKTAPVAAADAEPVIAISPKQARAAVMALSLDYEEPDVEVPTEPEVTEPEVTEPEVTEPEVTEPEPTEPEVTEPEPTKPSIGSIITGFIKNIINKLFSRWF